MMWPSQGVLIFTVMAAVPPVIAIYRENIVAFAISLLASILAWKLAHYTHLVPVAIGLLIISFLFALRKLNPEDKRATFWARTALLLSPLIVILASNLTGDTDFVSLASVLLIVSFFFAFGKLDPAHKRAALGVRVVLLLSPFIAIAAYALKLSLLYNWNPPRVLERSLASSLSDRDEAMKQELNSQFPNGTDEAILKSTLLKQGFQDVPQPRPSCRLPDTRGMSYGPCPKGAREMKYDFEHFSFVCGTSHISVNWSVDLDGKITRLEATKHRYCW
jgi:hypothetical protein